MASLRLSRAFLVFNLVIYASATIIPRVPAGTQFITGACKSDADCASSCCGFHSGKCAGPVIAQERDGGCGFGDPQPNNIAAQAIQGPNAEQPGGGHGPLGGSSSSSTPSSKAPSQAPASNPASDPASDAPGAANVGKKNGSQFITGQCTSDSDCQSGCCGFKSGLCAGPVIAQTRDGGCGFGDSQPNDTAAKKLGFTGSSMMASPPASSNKAPVAPASDAPGAANVGKKNGSQFITGQCTSDADCQSACCGFKSGLCAGPVIAQTRDGGCGFGDAQPNDTAAKKLGFQGSPSPAPASTPSSSSSSSSNNPASAAPGAENVGKKNGSQFITGQCTSDADCQSGCCGFKSGLCAGPIIAQTRDGGCGFGNSQPNDNAAKKLQGRSRRSSLFY